VSVSLILASASPARLATLRRAGVEPHVIVSGVDETLVQEPVPVELARRLAELKGRAVLATVPALPAGERLVLVACDSVFEIDGAAYGKPVDADEARRRLRAQSGRSGVLHTGHFVVDVASGESRTRTASTGVTFATLSDAEIDAYVATGEPVAVAGAFTVDGLGAAFVERVDGDHHNVVGISLPLLRLMLAELEVAWTELWQARDSG
jgi:septum formation protein